MYVAYVLLVFFTLNGEPTTKSLLAESTADCTHKAATMVASMADDPSFKNIVFECKAIRYIRHMPI